MTKDELERRAAEWRVIAAKFRLAARQAREAGKPDFAAAFEGFASVAEEHGTAGADDDKG